MGDGDARPDRSGPSGKGGESRESAGAQTQTPSHRNPRERENPDAPAKVAGDVDEAREIPTDVAIRAPGEPDAFAQGPAAAPAMTDEEAGADDRPLEGGITPLTRGPRS